MQNQHNGFRAPRLLKYRAISASPVSRTWSALLSLVPALTLGLASAVPFLYWGLWLRSRRLVAVGAGYVVAGCLCLALLNGTDSNGSLSGAFTGFILLTLACVGTAHTFVLRHELLGEFLRPRVGDAAPERQAAERIGRREYARSLLQTDPLLAYELRIGRPDLPRDFDDGGLVDVNHAPASTLARIPEISEQMAAQIVAARESVGGFSSVDDMSVVVGCAPQVFDRPRDLLLFVA